MNENDPTPPSPFHAGELELQRRAGVLERMAAFAPKVVRPFMPQQHRDFYASLPFVVMAAVDEGGAPWVSLLAGAPGFLSSPDERRLQARARFAPGDPLEAILRPGTAVGLLGIELSTRRRNRLSAKVRARDGQGFALDVVQSFGNCPQYIQTRALTWVRDPADPPSAPPPERFTTLSEAHRAWIRGADTFFVGSALPAQTDERLGARATQGADASHRGGRPGFVKVEGDTLTVPEYPGNLHFNTLGNFLLYPRAGLCFVDFETGDLLLLTGSVELLWAPDALTRAFAGAERAWRFTLDQGLHLRAALPLRWAFGEYSPNTLLTGDWDQAAARLQAEALREAWRPFTVARVRDEARDIRSFFVEPADGLDIPAFEAGQYLSLQVPVADDQPPLLRTYTVSSAPGERPLRISVQREERGGASAWLHDHLQPGSTVQARTPRGAFTFDAQEKRPAVLLAGGIGITPMVAMARHAGREALRLRYARPITLIHVARSPSSRAFFEELQALAAGTPALRYVSLLTGDLEGAKPGVDFHGHGRLSADTLRALLPLDDYDFYLCGPAGFMQACYDALLSLGVRDARIHAEAFGPSQLRRRAETPAVAVTPPPEAETAVVRFTRAGFEQRWSHGEATLLELAEAHGLSPPYSCRSGSCGSCATGLISGRVAYRRPPTATIPEGQALICCAVPAEGTEVLALAL